MSIYQGLRAQGHGSFQNSPKAGNSSRDVGLFSKFPKGVK